MIQENLQKPSWKMPICAELTLKVVFMKRLVSLGDEHFGTGAGGREVEYSVFGCFFETVLPRS